MMLIKGVNTNLALLMLSLFVQPLFTISTSAQTDASIKDAPAPRSQITKIQVEAVPASVELPSDGRAAKSLLILHNTGAAKLERVEVTYFTDANVEMRSDPPFSQAQDIGPNAESFWKLETVNKGKEPVNGNILLLVKYDYEQGNNQPVPQATYAVVQVKSREADDVADIKLETALESLDYQHPGKVYLLITNKLDQTIVVDDVKWDAPGFIKIDEKEFRAKKAANDQSLAFLPRQTGAIPFDVGVSSRVQSGKHLILATVRFKLAGGNLTRDVVVSRTVEVGVLGESAILKVFGIPSFLLIPGILAVATWGLLWRWGLFKLKQDMGKNPLEFSQQPTSPEFWVVAVTTSVVVFLTYMRINPDILGSYGLWDLVVVWLISVFGFGVLGYTLIALGRGWYIRRRTPSADDEPIDILKKLARQGLGITLKVAGIPKKSGEDGALLRALLLQRPQDEKEQIWVGPPIKLQFKEGFNSTVKAEIKKHLNTAAGDVGEVARLIEGAVCPKRWQRGVNRLLKAMAKIAPGSAARLRRRLGLSAEISLAVLDWAPGDLYVRSPFAAKLNELSGLESSDSTYVISE